MAEGVRVGRGYIEIRPQFVGNWNQQITQQINVNQGAVSSRFDAIGNTIAGSLIAGFIRQGVGDKISSSLTGPDVKITAMAGAATSAVAAITPLVGVAAGLGAAFGVAGAGVGAFAALAKPQITAVTGAVSAVTKAQDAYNTAIATGNTKGATKALQDQQKALATLTPAQRTAVQAQLSFNDAFHKTSDALAPKILGPYTAGLKTLQGLLPSVASIAGPAGDALKGIFDKAQKGIQGANFQGFVNTLRSQVGPTITSLGSIAGNAGGVLSHVFQAAMPLIQPVLKMVNDLFAQLNRSAAGQGLADFFKRLQPLVAQLGPTLGSVVKALGDILRAALPLAGPVLSIIKTLADTLATLFKSADFTAFVANIGSVINSLKPLLPVLGQAIGQIVHAVSGQLAAIMPQLVQVASQFVRVFADVITGITPALPAILDLVSAFVKMIPVLYPIITALRDALVPVIQAFAAALLQAKPYIGQMVTAIIQMLPPLSQILVALVPIVPVLVQALVPGIQLFAQVLKLVAPILTPIISLFVKLLPVILPILPIFLALTNPIADVIFIVMAAAAAFSHMGGIWHAVVTGMKAIWDNVLHPVWNALAAAATWLWNTVLLPVFNFIGDHWRILITGIKLYWDNVLHPVFNAYAAVLTWLWNSVVKPVVNFIGDHWRTILTAMKATWDGVLHPAFNAVAAIAQWLWNSVLRPVFTFIGDHWRLILTGIKAAWDNVLHPTWNAVSTAIQWLWNSALKPVFGFIGTGWRALGDGMRWVLDHVVSPMLTAMANGFQVAKDAIKQIWDGIRDAVAAPIKFVVNTVYEDGIRKVVNAVSNFVHAGDVLPDLHFREGGPLPRSIPGNHNMDIVPFYGTPGEVVVPQPVVNRYGGPDSFMGMLGFAGKGNGAGSGHFATGGVLDLSGTNLSGLSGLGQAAGAASGAAAAQQFVQQRAALTAAGAKADGGILGRIVHDVAHPTDLIGDLSNLVQGAMAAVLTPMIHGLEGVADKTLGGMGGMGHLAGLGVHKLGDQIISFVQSKDAAYNAAKAASAGGQYGASSDFGGVKPWVAYSGHMVGSQFGVANIGGVRPDAYPDHPSGHALDFMTYGNVSQQMALADYLQAGQHAHNIEYLIRRPQIWTREAGYWRGMEDRGSPTANHMDHVHATYMDDPYADSLWARAGRPLFGAAFSGPAAGASDGSQVGNARVIANVAKAMGLSRNAVEIALMTSLQESGLKNINYGDRDSLGLFQQRPSQGWGSPAQIMDPSYAARKFFEALGNVGHWESMPLTYAAQAVQRSAYPEAYAKWQGQADSLLPQIGFADGGRYPVGKAFRVGERGMETLVMDQPGTIIPNGAKTSGPLIGTAVIREMADADLLAQRLAYLQASDTS